MRGRGRASGLVLSPLLALWAVAIAAGGAGAAEEHLFRATSTATAVHGFYDHADLFPVPIGNLSVPETEVSLDVGPSVGAHGSFLWDPQAAELSTIVCELSNGQMCDLPEYPFQARATYPPSGDQEQPPTLTIDDPSSPVHVAGADESATATARAASARSTVAGMEAVPMTGGQLAAARSLALAAAAVRAGDPLPVPLPGGLSTGLPGSTSEQGPSPSPSSPSGDVSPWLVAVGAASSASTMTSGPASASVRAASSVHDLSLLGGVITIQGASGEAAASQGATTGGTASARYGAASVGGVPASVGPDGLQIQDQDLGGDQIAALQAALDQALSQAGISVSLGSHTVTRSDGLVISEAWALSIDATIQVVPPGAPQGAGGADVLHIPVGYARATAEVASFAGPPPFTAPSISPPPPPPPSTAPPPPPPPPSGGGGHTGGGGGGAAPPPNGGIGPPPPAPGRPGGGGGGRSVRFVPVGGRLSHGIPPESVVLLGLSGVAFVIGMTGLKTMESLTEGVRR